MRLLLLQMRPMCQELFQLSDPQLVVVQAGALLATAAVMAANQRTLLQRYLDRALAGKHPPLRRLLLLLLGITSITCRSCLPQATTDYNLHLTHFVIL